MIISGIVDIFTLLFIGEPDNEMIEKFLFCLINLNIEFFDILKYEVKRTLLQS